MNLELILNGLDKWVQLILPNAKIKGNQIYIKKNKSNLMSKQRIKLKDCVLLKMNLKTVRAHNESFARKICF